MPTKIEWTDETWNPITGCTPISIGCENCYAAKMAKRLAGRFDYPKEKPFTPGVEHPTEWTKLMHWRKPRRVFVCSMGDLFHRDYTDGQIKMVLDYCRQYSQHTFQILTKRPDRCAGFDFPSNVWLGTTVEAWSRQGRIESLSRANVRVKFLSCEPLLSPISLEELIVSARINWVIVGAETGQGARPMSLDWARAIRDECARNFVPFFFKRDSQGRKILDGVEHHAFPL